jgi:Kef-type K+ transport system membrane component KefB
VLDLMQENFQALSPMARFTVGMALLALVPALCRRLHVPQAVGLLLAGVLFGPHVLDVFSGHGAVADFFGEMGKLMLMFLRIGVLTA